MKIEGNGKLLRIFVGERDHRQGQPLYTAIVEALRHAGVAGATVFKGIEGYGRHSVVHAARVFDLSTELPIVIEAVDTEERIRAALPVIDAMLSEGLLTLENVEFIRYKAANAQAREERS